MSFEKAAQMVEGLVGVPVREATRQRHTSRAGQIVQKEEDKRSQTETKGEPVSEKAPAQMAISADGACVPLVGGIWAEAHPRAMATVHQRVHTIRSTDLSYFPRMTEATTFPHRCPGERERRHRCEAKAVAGVIDGAEWLPGLLDVPRPDAVRVLDFPPPAQRVSAIIDTAQQAGRPLLSNALKRRLHLLKHRSSWPILRWLRHLSRTLDSPCNAHEDLAS